MMITDEALAGVTLVGFVLNELKLKQEDGTVAE